LVESLKNQDILGFLEPLSFFLHDLKSFNFLRRRKSIERRKTPPKDI
jgi:hypothetical protein